jgi:hypothetical protein
MDLLTMAGRREYAGMLRRSTVKQDEPGGYWRYYCATCRWVSGGGDNNGDASEMGARNTGADHRAVWHR